MIKLSKEQAKLLRDRDPEQERLIKSATDKLLASHSLIPFNNPSLVRDSILEEINNIRIDAKKLNFIR